MSLYQKHRPPVFDQIIGEKNQKTALAIQEMLSRKDPPHAYLLTGPHGCGKTSMGRIIGNELGCVGDDFREIDSADFRGIDTVREIRRVMHIRPLQGKRRGWLIDECHKMTNDAQNALLKGLEDAPSHCFFVLATTDPDKLLKTVRSRCVIYSVFRLGEDEMMKLLRRVISAESLSLPRNVMQAIVDAAHGHPRDAIQILETVSNDPGKAQALIDGRDVIESNVRELYGALIRQEGWKSISATLNELKAAEEDPEGIRRFILACCSNELLRGESDRAAVIADEFINHFYDTGFPGLVYACYTVFRAG